MFKIVTIVLPLLIFACSSDLNITRNINEYKTYDGAFDLSKSDFLETLNKPYQKPKKISSMKIAKLIKTPNKPADVKEKLISINVTEDVPLKDVLLEIARMADIDVQISPKIQASIIFSSKNKPLSEILDSITEVASVRYKKVKNILIFEPDDPYVETYNVNFINLIRTSTASKSSSNSLAGSGSSASQTSSSSFSITTKSEDNLWDDIELSIKQIISEDYLNMKQDKLENTPSDKMIIVSREADNAKNVGLVGNNNEPKEPKSGKDLPLLSVAGGESVENEKKKPKSLDKESIAINKQGGLIAVFGTQKAHKKIDKYLKLLQKKMMAQVLIEVKILEVTLDSTYQNGIDWSNVMASLGNIAISASTGFGSNLAKLATTTPLSIVAQNGSATATISILNKFGTVRTVLSPRLNATSNQSATMGRADNNVYFNMTITNNFVNTGTINTSNAQQFTISATPQTIPIGTDLSIHPVIDLEKREILMNVRPSISSLNGSVNDPAFEYIANASGSTALKGVHNAIPQTTAKTFDTMVKIKDGDMVIMGGFTSRINSVTEAGFPFISDIPFLGTFFRQKLSVEQTVETVVLIKATIIDEGFDGIEDGDKNLYNKMAQYNRKVSL